MFNGKKYLNQEDVIKYILHSLDFDVRFGKESAYRIKVYAEPEIVENWEKNLFIYFVQKSSEPWLPFIKVKTSPIYHDDNSFIGYHFDYALGLNRLTFGEGDKYKHLIEKLWEYSEFLHDLSDEINNLKKDIYFNNKEIEDFKYNSNCYCSRPNTKAVEEVLIPFCEEHDIPYYLDDINEMFYIGKEDDFIVGFRDVFDSEGRKELPEVAFFDLATDKAQAYERIDLNEDYSEELLKALEDIKGELENRKPSYEIENDEEERC